MAVFMFPQTKIMIISPLHLQNPGAGKHWNWCSIKGRLGWKPYQPGGYSLLLISHLPSNIYGITIMSKDETNKMNLNQNPLPTEQVGIGKRISHFWNFRNRRAKLIILSTGLVLNCCCVIIPLSSKLWNATKSLIQKRPPNRRLFSFWVLVDSLK